MKTRDPQGYEFRSSSPSVPEYDGDQQVSKRRGCRYLWGASWFWRQAFKQFPPAATRGAESTQYNTAAPVCRQEPGG